MQSFATLLLLLVSCLTQLVGSSACDNSNNITGFEALKYDVSSSCDVTRNPQQLSTPSKSEHGAKIINAIEIEEEDLNERKKSDKRYWTFVTIAKFNELVTQTDEVIQSWTLNQLNVLVGRRTVQIFYGVFRI